MAGLAAQSVMYTAIDAAERIAERLSKLAGMAAVALGGSWARGTAHEDSDLDLGLYYYPEQRFSIAELSELARQLDHRHSSPAHSLPSGGGRVPNDPRTTSMPVEGLVTPFGEWGPWINGGGWLLIEGRHVDFLYRDLDKVADVVARCSAGQITCDYQIGHPAGFHNHIYMGEVHYCRALHDPGGVLRALKRLTAEYPPAMRRAIIDKYLYEARFSTAIADKPAGRGDVHYVAGCLFRAVGCIVQVLFALNRQYFVNEKGSLRAVESFELKPPNFTAQVAAIEGATGATADELAASVRHCGQLVEAVAGLWVNA